MPASRLSTVILAAILAASCGGPTPAVSTAPTASQLASPTASDTPGSSIVAGSIPTATPAAATSAATPAPTGASGVALPTPPIEDGAIDPTQLVPPIPDEGEVPAPAEPNPPITGTLTLGPATEVARQTIGPAGGTIAAGGLEIRVPDGALAAETPFTVSQAPITAHTFGDLITPITPLYEVESGEAALGAPVTLVLPAAIPAGTTAMAFYYDATAGTLTPLIPIAQDATTLTVGATHFSGLFGGLIDLLKLPEIVDSGFRPGSDDWQFTNYGSFIAPGGQCEGQSLTAIWYYLAQRRGGASPLNGLYDNNGAPTKTPALQWDDSDGYRLAGNVQVDPVADQFTYEFLKNAMWDRADGRLTYQAFRAAMALTGEPQLIRLSTAPGTGNHTMIVYRVTPQWLLIADPNYPGRLRTIRYDAARGKLGDYSSGDNAADIAANGATIYTRFAYVPWRSSASEAGIAAHWAEFEGGTAGDAVFPGYVLKVLTGKDAQGKDVWAPLTDGYRTGEKKLTVQLTKLTGGTASTMAIYRGTSAVPLGPKAWKQTIDLDEGDNALGFSVFGRVGAAWEYVDFVRLTVTSGESTDWELADVQVKHTGVSVNQEYTWSFEGDGRGGITTTWRTAYGTRASATVTASWHIPDRLTPGTDVDVSGELAVTIDYESQAASLCAGGMYQVGPEDGFLIARALNETGAEPDLAGYTLTNAQRISIVGASIGCDSVTGKMVPAATASGSFSVPDRLVPAAGQSAWLVVLFSVMQDLDTVSVAYIYK